VLRSPAAKLLIIKDDSSVAVYAFDNLKVALYTSSRPVGGFDIYGNRVRDLTPGYP